MGRVSPSSTARSYERSALPSSLRACSARARWNHWSAPASAAAVASSWQARALSFSPAWPSSQPRRESSAAAELPSRYQRAGSSEFAQPRACSAALAAATSWVAGAWVSVAARAVAQMEASPRRETLACADDFNIVGSSRNVIKMRNSLLLLPMYFCACVRCPPGMVGLHLGVSHSYHQHCPRWFDARATR